MTGRITIGRFGLDLDTTEIDTWNVSDGRVQVSGECFFSTVAEGLAARQQVAGLVEYPDPVYVSWADDSTQDGFYRVVAATANTGDLTLVTGNLPWSVTLERSRGYAGLQPEIAISAITRAVAPVLAGYYQYAVCTPTAYAKKYSSTPTVTTRTILGGATLDHAANGVGSRAVLTGTPDLLYVGAVKIRMGDPLYTVIGRQNENLPDDWELSNGITTVTPPTGTAGLFKIQTVTSAGAAATVTYEVNLGSIITGTFTDVTAITRDTVVVVRESIESCAIRIAGRVTAASTLYTYTLDLILNRGDRGVVAVFESSGSRQWGAAWSTTIASTLLASLDGALQANSADADSNKPVLAIVANATNTDDAANGKVWIDSALTLCTIFASSSCAGSANTAAVVVGDFAAPCETRQKMVHP